MTLTPTETPRVAVVTGGGSGIGRSTCRHLGAAGHRIGILDLDGGRAEAVADELREEGVDALALAVDVVDRGQVEAAFAKVRAELGPTEILVTSAGMVAFDDFATTFDDLADLDDFAATFDDDPDTIRL